VAFGRDSGNALDGEEAQGAFDASVVLLVVVRIPRDAERGDLGFEEWQFWDSTTGTAELEDAALHGVSVAGAR
jgi:hypothetical protein